MRSAIVNSAVRPVVIVLLDPTSDVAAGFFQAPILRRPDFLFFQAAMEPFDIAVAFRVVIGRAAMRNGEPPQRLQEALSTYLIKLACLGGYLVRAGDSPPGNRVIWRGLSRLTDFATLNWVLPRIWCKDQSKRGGRIPSLFRRC